MSKSTLDAVLSLLGETASQLESSQEGALVMQEFRKGKITLEEAASKLLGVAGELGLLGELREASTQLDSVVPGFSMSPAALRAAGRPVRMKTATGIDQVNPLLEAAFAERLTLDGDIPEIRLGLLPPGGKPAPWVKAITRDPVILGLMLDRASNEVWFEMADSIEDHQVHCQKLLAEARSAGDAELVRVQNSLPSVPTGVEGYQAGRVPAFREVAPPSPLVVGAMNTEYKQVAIFQVLATTQGRSSAAPVIENAVREILEEAGIPLAPATRSPASEVRETTWAMRAFGPRDLSENFNPIQNAINHLSSWALVHTASGTPPVGGWVVAATAYNKGISERRFGWTLTIGTSQRSP
jgi:hypothetical protein